MDSALRSPRQLWKRIAATLAFCIFLSAPLALGAQNQNTSCLQSAVSDRTNQLQSVYNDYARDMQRISSDFGSRENNAVANSDVSYQMNEINRASADYSAAASQIANNLSVRVSQIWAAYQSRRVSCGAGPVGIPNYTAPYGYGNQSYYGSSYPYSGYQYGSCPYSYGSTNYPYQYPYGNSYGTQYGYGGTYPYNQYQQIGGSSYSYNGDVVCVQPILNYTLPAGCGYDCRLDNNRCRSCQISCRGVSSKNYRGCGCSSTYRPVCGRDEITYVNDCYAECAGVEVRHMGLCH